MKKPNVLMIVADQFRGDTLGCMAHPDIKTPFYDSIANNGTLFLNAYSTNPICVPARATMITGKYPHKVVEKPDGYKSNGGHIKDNVFKLPQFLASNGYKTYSSGKLHYLPYTPPDVPNTLHGFQKAVLAESGRMLSFFDLKNNRRGVEDYIDYLEDAGWKGYSRAHGVGNNDIHPAPSPLPQEHCVDSWVATKAIEYIKEHQKNDSDKPFFVHASFPKPHSPYDPPRPYDQMYDPRQIQKPAINKDGKDRTPHMVRSSITHGFNFLSPEAFLVARAHYYGLISFQDQQVGRMLECLKNAGLYEDTIILFTADHGDMMGDFGFFFKTSMHEGSARVPLFFAWPKGIPKKQVSKALVGIQDIVPTILDLAGFTIPDDLDGISLKSDLLGKPNKPREFLISYSLEPPVQNYMVRDHIWKYIYNEANGVEELYHMLEDPREEINLIGTQPPLEKAMREKIIDFALANGDHKILKDGQLVKTNMNPLESVFSPKSMGWRWY